MNWADEYERSRNRYRMLVSGKHLKIFQFQDEVEMHFMGISTEGGEGDKERRK